MSQSGQYQLGPAGGMPIETLTGDTGGPVAPDAGQNIDILAADGVNNSGSSVSIVGTPASNKLVFNVTDSIENTIIGFDAGNGTLTGIQNVGLGDSALNSVTSGSTNTAVGYISQNSVTSGSNNTSIGSGSLLALDTGSANIAIGQGSGGNYGGAESNNILIGNSGTLAENAVIKIGTNGTHTTAFMQGIAGVAVANELGVVINSATGQLGTNGAVALQYDSDAGSAVPAAGILNVLGGSNINTAGAGDTLTVNLDNAVTISGTFTTTGGNVNIGNAAPATGASLAVEESVNGVIAATVQNTSVGASAASQLQLLVEPATADPAVAYVVNGANTWSTGIDNSDADNFKITTGSSPSAGTEVINLTSAGVVEFPQYGTGVIASDSSGVLSSITGTDGQIIVGATGLDPIFASLTSTGGTITISGGPNTLNIETAAGGGLTWNEETGTSATMAVNNGYIANNVGLVTLTLPAAASLGDTIRVTGKGAGGWKIAQNAGQTIYFGNQSTATGAGGSLDSTNDRDSVELVCVTANNDFNVLSSVGNITVT